MADSCIGDYVEPTTREKLFRKCKYKIEMLCYDIATKIKFAIFRMLFPAKDSGLMRHAKSEMELLGWHKPGKDGDRMQILVYNNILDLFRVFSSQGHSGTSAPYVVKRFEHLASYKILSPITNNPDEWNDVTEQTIGSKIDDSKCMHQSRRGPAYFSDDNLKTYYDLDEKKVNGKYVHHKLKDHNG